MEERQRRRAVKKKQSKVRREVDKKTNFRRGKYRTRGGNKITIIVYCNRVIININ